MPGNSIKIVLDGLGRLGTRFSVHGSCRPQICGLRGNPVHHSCRRSRGCPRNCKRRAAVDLASLMPQASGRPDSRHDPRARRPAVIDENVLGRGAPVVACNRWLSCRISRASRPRQLRPAKSMGWRCRQSPTISTATAISSRCRRGSRCPAERSASDACPEPSAPAPLPAPLGRPPQPADLTPRPQPRRAADRVRQGDAGGPLSAAGRELPGHVRPRLLRLCRRCRRTRSASTTRCRDCGSCRRRRCCPMAAPTRGLPISCFLNAVPIRWKASSTPGTRMCGSPPTAAASAPIGASVRSIGEKVKGSGETSGIIPFIHVMDGLTLAISQGSLRRGSAAVLSRHPSSGDRGVPRNPQGRRAISTARASISITASTSPTSSWKRCATARCSRLRSPKSGEVMREVDARQLWQTHSRNAPPDRRALSPLHRHGEPRACRSISASSVSR